MQRNDDEPQNTVPIPHIPTSFGRSNHQSRVSLNHVLLDQSFVMKERLDRAVVLISHHISNLEEVESIISAWDKGLEDVIVLSQFKFIAIFSSRELAENFIKVKPLEEAGWDSRKWIKTDQLGQRRTSIAIRGIPVQAWSENSVRVIAQHFGSITSIDTNMKAIPNYLEAHVQIETNRMQIINGEISVDVNGDTRKVGIVEYWSEELTQHRQSGEEEEQSSDFQTPHHVVPNEAPPRIIAERFDSQEKNDELYSNNISTAWKLGKVIPQVSHVRFNSPLKTDAWHLSPVPNGLLFSLSLSLPRKIILSLPIPIPRVLRFINPKQLISACGHLLNCKLALQVTVPPSLLHLVYAPTVFSPVLTHFEKVPTQPEETFSSSLSPPTPTYSHSLASQNPKISSLPSSPTPLSSSSSQLPGIQLQVILSPDSSPHSSIPSPIGFIPSSSCSSPASPLSPTLTEAQACLEYGRKLGCHFPHPEITLQNITRVLQHNKEVKEKPILKRNVKSTPLAKGPRSKPSQSKGNSLARSLQPRHQHTRNSRH